MAPTGTAEAANPGPGARAAEEDRQQDVVMTTQPTKPEGKLKPQHAVELSSSDSYESKQDKAEAPKIAGGSSKGTEDARVAGGCTKGSRDGASAFKARRNRRSIQEEGMVQCPICWTPVKKDGLESHQQYSSYCAQWRKFQESGQKAEKGQQGKDDEDVKKMPPLRPAVQQAVGPLAALPEVPPEEQGGQGVLGAHAGQESQAGRVIAGGRQRTDRVRLRSRTPARRHDDRRDGSRPRTRSRPRHHETRERRSSPSPTPGSSRSSKPGAATVLESFLQTTTRILDLQDRKG